MRKLVLTVLMPIFFALLPVAAVASPRATPAEPIATAVPIASVSTLAKQRGSVRLTWGAKIALRDATVRLNGHTVTWLHLPLQAGQSRTVTLDIGDGARFGRNAIVVSALSRGGRSFTYRRNVTVIQDAPLVDISSPATAKTTYGVRLNGRSSKAAQGGRLSHRWRIVRAPRSARARLSHAATTRPTLLAKTPGHYRLALTVREASARSSATATADIAVSPSTTAMGVAFDSMAKVGAQTGIRVGTTFIALPQNSAQLVLLDAQTLEVLSSGPADPTSPDPLALAEILAQAESSQGRNVLIVVAGLPGCCIPSKQNVSQDGFTMIEHYTPVYGNGEDSGDNSPAQQPPTENQGLTLANGPRSAPGAPGELRGWLQLGTPVDGAAPLYSYVSPDRVPFDTQSTSTATSNTISVGDDAYSATLPSTASAGFEVLVTDSGLDHILESPIAFGTNDADPSVSASQELAMAQLLDKALLTPGATVFVQSIGTPKPASPSSVPLAVALDALGGTESLFLGLDGTGSYALVGNANGPVGPLRATAAEASSRAAKAAGGARAPGTGTLTGLLRRRPDSAFAPLLADSIGGQDYSLEQITYQSATPWPATDTAAGRNAYSYVSQQIGFRPGSNGCFPVGAGIADVRAAYCLSSFDPDSVLSGALPTACASGPGAGYTQADLDAVCSQLKKEIADVGQVKGLIGTLTSTFSGASPAVDVAAIAGQIQQSIPDPVQDATSGNLGLAGAVLGALAVIPEAGFVFGPVAAALDIGSELSQDGGQPSPDWTIQSDADALGATVGDRLTAESGALTATGDIILSDWGKLSAVAALTMGPSAISDTSVTQQKSNLELGVKQWLWTALASSTYTLVAIPGIHPVAAIQCYYDIQSHLWSPWATADTRSAFYPKNMFDNGVVDITTTLGLLSGDQGDRGSTGLTPAVADTMFDPPPSGVGLVPEWLERRGSWQTVYPKIDPNGGSPGFHSKGECMT